VGGLSISDIITNLFGSTTITVSGTGNVRTFDTSPAVVLTNSDQTITGIKTFTSALINKANVTNTSGLIVTNSINSIDRVLTENGGNGVIHYAANDLRLIDDSPGGGSTSLNWKSRTGMDSSGNTSWEWGNRQGRNSSGFITFSYQNGDLSDNYGAGTPSMNWTNHTTYANWGFMSNVNVGASVFVTNSLTCSNLVTQTTDATSYINSTTNQLLRVIANGSAGILQTEALYTVRTNSLTQALPVHNAIYTNNAIRLHLSANMLMQIGTGVAVWTANGSITNYYDRKIATSITTNSVSGWVQPFALYCVTNFTGSAPTLIPGEWNETRQ
jgi:hypothetical protein